MERERGGIHSIRLGTLKNPDEYSILVQRSHEEKEERTKKK